MHRLLLANPSGCVVLTSYKKSDVNSETVAVETGLLFRKRQIESQMEKVKTVNKMARAAALHTLYWLAKEELPQQSTFHCLSFVS